MSEFIWMPHGRLEAGYMGSRLRYGGLWLTQRRRGVTMTRGDKTFLGYALTWGLLALGIAAFLLLAARAASAQDIDSRWILRPLAQQCLDDPACRSTLRRPRGHRPHYTAPSRNHAYHLPEREQPRMYRSYDRRGEPERRVALRCADTKEAKGPEAYTSEGALRVANRAWQSAVRSDHGERFMDIKHAGNYRWTCYRSSTNESIVGKSLEFLASRTLIRCTVWAKPCQAPIIEGIPEKGSVKQELEEEGVELNAPPGRQPAGQFTR